MRKIIIFAGLFIMLYTGAFFYIGVKKFNYSGNQHTASISQVLHSS